ncbi:MAG: Metal-dependent hydrolase [Promethearchaeota archaeon]|nr:MAG: Metal-dependent hydrolase [Candidatus Lokiarchaeota archaeon]
MKKFYDISLLLNENTIVYPGNPQISIEQYAFIPDASVNESKISFGVHSGTHVDSPYHIKKDGKKANQLKLESFYGDCKVLDLTHVNLEIHKDDLLEFDLREGNIILFKTQNSLRGYKEFRKDFVHVKYDAADYLVEVGIKTLGVDYLSVKKFGGDDEVHELIITNMTLFEGLNLKEVSEGEYTFIGLPLKLEADGSPARVVLLEK